MSFCHTFPHLNGDFEQNLKAVQEHIRGENPCADCRKRAKAATLAKLEERLNKATKHGRFLFVALAQFTIARMKGNENRREIEALALILDQDDMPSDHARGGRDRNKQNGNGTRPGNGSYSGDTARYGK